MDDRPQFRGCRTNLTKEQNKQSVVSETKLLSTQTLQYWGPNTVSSVRLAVHISTRVYAPWGSVQMGHRYCSPEGCVHSIMLDWWSQTCISGVIKI